MQIPGESQSPCCWKIFFGAGRWQGSAYRSLGRREVFEVRWLPSCPRCASLIEFISNNISWRQSFLGNKSGDCCNLCDGLPRCVSRCKYVGIKEYVFLAPDMKTNSVLTVNQQPKDPWQTNTLPGQHHALSLQQGKLLSQLKQDLVGLKGIVPNSHTAEGQSGSTVSLMPQWLSSISRLLMRMKKEARQICVFFPHPQQSLWETMRLSSASNIKH